MGTGDADRDLLERLGALERRLGDLDNRLLALELRRVVAAGRPDGERRGSVDSAEPTPRRGQPGWLSVRRASPGQAGVAPVASVEAPTEMPQAGEAGAGPLGVGPAAPAAGVVPAVPAWSATSLRDLEQRLTGRLMAWAGAAAIVIGAVFFLSLAFSRGWIGPTERVAIGLVASAAFVGLGAWLFERRQALLGHVLVAVGLGVGSLALFAGTRLYGVFSPEVGLAAAFVAAVVTAVIAIRADSQAVAAFGLVAVAAAPPVLGAAATLVTVAFLAAALVGTTAIALARSWRWLPGIAFALTVPQVARWISDRPDPPLALAVVAGYWLLNALAAAGDDLRLPRLRIERRAGLLIGLVALFTLWAGLTTLTGELDARRGAFVAVLAAAHLGFAGWFFRMRGDRYPFGLLLAGVGVALGTLAVALQWDGPAVAIGWAAGAVALAAVAGVRRHRESRLGAAAVGSLAVAHLAIVEYPLERWDLAGRQVSGWPFGGEGGLALAGLLVAIALAGWLLRRGDERFGLAAVGMLLLAYALPFEMTGLALLAAWATLAPASLAVGRLVDRLAPERASAPLRPTTSPAETTQPAAVAAAVLYPTLGALGGATLGLAHLASLDLPIDRLNSIALPTVPFADLGTAASASVVAAALVAAWLTTSRAVRSTAVVVAFAVAGYLVTFELDYPFRVVAWSALAIASGWWSLRPEAGRAAAIGTAAALVACGAVQALGQVATPERLAVAEWTPPLSPPFIVGAVLALGSLAAVLAVGARFAPEVAGLPRDRVRAGLALGAAGCVAYLLSVGVVDAFQVRLGGPILLEELQKQAQVALSILWAVLGVGAFVFGVVRWRSMARESGLALLALATAKVFLFDLSYLDVAYRVISFIGLGLLLLLGAYVFQALRPRLGGPGSQAHPT